MSKQALLASAKLRRGDVTVEGLKIFIVEPPVMLRIDYSAEYKKDRPKAMAALIHACCYTEEGEKMFTEDEAKEIASGSARVAVPLINAILGEEEDEKVKNGSAPSAAFSSSSPAT